MRKHIIRQLWRSIKPAFSSDFLCFGFHKRRPVTSFAKIPFEMNHFQNWNIKCPNQFVISVNKEVKN